LRAKDIKHITIIGAGLMGYGIALVFAQKNYSITLVDVKDELLRNAVENIKATIYLLTTEGLKLENDIDTILNNITTTTSLEEAVSEAQLVIEAVSENLELKQKIFKDMDGLCDGEVILTTNTSVISVSEIAEKAQKKKRIVGTHFWNPPYMIPLVEVVKGNDTSTETMNVTYEIMKLAGKHPVKVMKDVPGFIGNRLQHALWREAISIVNSGIADAMSVDDVIKKGFGIRLPVLGPLETADMTGLDLALAIHNYILKYIEAGPSPSPILVEKVQKGDLGFKTGQGFYSWNEKSIKESRERLLKYLIDWSKRSQ
jgi:3-hydroxybutyryl-CoA dehydrogenase